jgi:hypothetical protein
MSSLVKRFAQLACLASLALGLSTGPACQPAFPTEVSGRTLVVTLAPGSMVGSPTSRLPLTFQTPDVFTVHVEAHDDTGAIDTAFNGYVRFSIQPGTVVSVAGPNTNGRNAQLVNGVADGIKVSVVGAFGDARIWANDLGYVPADPAGVPLPGGGTRPPQCSNGIDDNQNGLVDYPVDPGCYAPNDDSEDGGSYAGGSTDVLYFVYPRIADVQGVDNVGAGTPFPNEQVQIDTQWNGTTGNTPLGVVVVGISQSGFFATDLGEGTDYSSIYGYTYSAPTLMNVCDRLMSLGGTSSEFYGFEELNYPTYSVESWDPVARPCLVPEPTPITIATLSDSTTKTTVLTPLEAGLVRVPAPDGSTIHISEKLGPGRIPYTTSSSGTVTITTPIQADATSCDYEGTGKINFSNPAEAACEAACAADVECSEYSQFLSSSQFQLVLVSATGGAHASITANGSLSPGFSPLGSNRGVPLAAFTGTLMYFSGGQQFTIQARCVDDIVPAGQTPLPSSPPWPTPAGQAQAPAACVVNPATTSSKPSN